MYYLESASMDPAWNLALEQFVFDQLGPREDCFMLWQNDRTIVVGKYQNVLEEINSTYVKEHGMDKWLPSEQWQRAEKLHLA